MRSDYKIPPATTLKSGRTRVNDQRKMVWKEKEVFTFHFQKKGVFAFHHIDITGTLTITDGELK